MTADAATRVVDVGGSCNALSVSPMHDRVAVGGRDVFKIVPIAQMQALVPNGIANLRTGKINLTFSSNDVQWNPKSSSLIATAATNGKVVIWDSDRSTGSKQDRVLTDHTRTVNRVSWHPFDPVLLSGSQDGTIKLWDMRVRQGCQATINGRCGSVRDVQWCSANPSYLAAGLDSGLVQIWDLRRTSAVELEISSHQGPVLCIDWHHDERGILATAGRDRLVKVWNLLGSPGDAPVHTIATVASVARVRWRPGFPSHLTTSSTLFDNRVHVWDLHHPFIPIATFSSHCDVVTGFQWLDRGTRIVTCSKDSRVVLANIATDSHCPYSSMRTSCLSWNITGDLAVVNDTFDRAEACNRRFIATPFHLVSMPSSPVGAVKILSPVDDSQRQFRTFAERYILSCASFTVLCAKNATVADDLGRKDLSRVWKICSSLFEDIVETEGTPTRVRRFSSDQFDVGGGMFELVTDHDISQRSLLECLPHVRPLGPSPVEAIRQGAISDLLCELADNGEIQTSASIIIVLGRRSHFLEARFVRRCLVSYIELLHRHQLWICANEVVRSGPDRSVASMNQNETKVSLRCHVCDEPRRRSEGMCGKCRSVQRCSVCRRRVTGIFVWCQGCGHGGCSRHILDWFRHNTQCPSGCLHQCRPNVVTSSSS
ncbi:WD domain, G-beta repeat [Plasmodiophora brassicae]